jgi:hypothetical protein
MAADNNIQPVQADTPTIEATYIQRPSATVYPSQQAFPATPPQQQKLVLRPDSNGNYNYVPVNGNEQTSAMNAPDYATTPGNAYSGGHYPPASQAVNYPVQTNTAYSSQPGNFAAPAFTQQRAVPPGGATPSSYPAQQKKRRGGGIVALLVALILLLVLSVGGFAIAQRVHLLGNTTGSTTGNTSGTTQSTPLPPVDQAKAVVQHYYTAINNKNYPEAYGLWQWGANAPTLASFENGYANTEHDALTIRNATQLSDGTVRVLMTVVATERLNGAIKHHTYAGYYTTGQVGNTWKILRGYLSRIK